VGSSVAVVGGGPAGLMAAEVLASAGAEVTVYERMPSVGRKLQLAGRGGLNLTHTEALDRFLDRYGPARPRLEAAIRAFGPAELRAWSAGLGQRAVVGTSGRVFPEAFRSTPLLRAWLGRLSELDVAIRTRWTWTGWTANGDLRFTTPEDGEVAVEPDVVVLALGGASWPRTGSDGGWVALLAGVGVDVQPLQPANVGFTVAWSEHFADHFGGTPLKNVAVTAGDAARKGEAMVTARGIEGGVVYALGPHIRDRVQRDGSTTIRLDLRPDLSREELRRRLVTRRPKDSIANVLRRAAGLTPVGIGLVREVGGPGIAHAPVDELVTLIKHLPVVVTGTAGIDRAISTAGGIALDEVDDRFMLRRRPGTFVAGEMLDWEAPTGGYLLQATFSTAVAAARGARDWLDR